MLARASNNPHPPPKDKGYEVPPDGLSMMLSYVFNGNTLVYGEHKSAKQITKYLFEKTFKPRLSCVRVGRGKDRTHEGVDVFLPDIQPKFVKEVVLPAIEAMLPWEHIVRYSQKIKRLRIEHVSHG